MSDDIIRELELLKHKIESGKSSRNAIDAEIKWTMAKLKEEFDCSSIPEAKQLLEELQSESQENRKKLVAEYQQLVNDVKLKGLV